MNTPILHAWFSETTFNNTRIAKVFYTEDGGTVFATHTTFDTSKPDETCIYRGQVKLFVSEYSQSNPTPIRFARNMQQMY